jgi:hypothetical protein
MDNFKVVKEKLLDRFQTIIGSLKSKNLALKSSLSDSFSDLKVNLTLFQDEIQRKILKNWNDISQKVTALGKDVEQRFIDASKKLDEIRAKLQPAYPGYTEINEGLETKQLIQGEMTYQDVDDFAKTLWENHDLAQIAFQETTDETYYEMAMDILLVIRELEQLKEYLMKHGKL